MAVVAVDADVVAAGGVVMTVVEVVMMTRMVVAYGKGDFVVVAAAVADGGVVGWALSVVEEHATRRGEAWFVCVVE